MDRLIRWSTVAVVVGVAGIAAYVSYMHAWDVARSYGEETAASARMMPLTIDGLIFASSMVLLYCARHDKDVPPLARWTLALGIAATLAANVAHGVASGLSGAIIAAWPAVALVLAYELLMWLIRSSGDHRARVPAPEPIQEPAHGLDEPHAPALETAAPEPAPDMETTPVPDDQQGPAPKPRPAPARTSGVGDAEAAREDYRASVAAGEPLSERALAARHGRSRNWARARIAETDQPDSGRALKAV